VGTGCCTRFATRIVSKRTAPGTVNRFKITIVDPEVKIEGFEYPSSNAYKEYVHAGETLGADEFKTIMDEVGILSYYLLCKTLTILIGFK
jgi:hypothetical protein